MFNSSMNMFRAKRNRLMVGSEGAAHMELGLSPLDRAWANSCLLTWATMTGVSRRMRMLKQSWMSSPLLAGGHDLKNPRP